MKKYTVIFAAVLFFALLASASGQVLYYSWAPSYSSIPPYSCTAPVGQFFLTPEQNAYRLTGPIYVSLPGYTYTISPVVFPSALPNAEATLTVLAPQRVITQYQLPRLAEVAPMWVDFSFISNVHVHKFTLYLNNPFDRINTKIVCLVAGATQ
jgi:hypothetical protein